MDSFEAEIGRNQHVFFRENTKQCTVVPDSQKNRTTPPARRFLQLGNQLAFRNGHVAQISVKRHVTRPQQQRKMGQVCPKTRQSVQNEEPLTVPARCFRPIERRYLSSEKSLPRHTFIRFALSALSKNLNS